MTFVVKIAQNGEEKSKKFRYPVTTSSAETQQEKIVERMRKEFVVRGGSVVDDEDLEVEIFEDSKEYRMINFQTIEGTGI